MERLDLESYKHVCFSYGICFGWLFPELKYSCTETDFQIRDVVYKYTDITGTMCSQSHFIIEIAHKCCLSLPISQNAQFKFLEKEEKRNIVN